MNAIEKVALEIEKQVKAMRVRPTGPITLPPPSGPGGYWREAGYRPHKRKTAAR
jgi:hypothetical protein